MLLWARPCGLSYNERVGEVRGQECGVGVAGEPQNNRSAEFALSGLEHFSQLGLDISIIFASIAPDSTKALALISDI